MAKMQIFVFALALVAQGYCSVAISTLPAYIDIENFPSLAGPVGPEVQPVPLPVAPELVPEEPATPPCVSVIKTLLQAIIDRLENLPELVPLPEVVEPLPEAPELPEEIPDVPEQQGNPCTACFEHINSLLTTAQKIAEMKARLRM